MFIGVGMSLMLLFTVPNKLYVLPELFSENFLKEYKKKFLNTTWNFEKVLAIFNVLFLTITTTVFLISFFLFIRSFNIERATKNSRNNITKKTIIISELIKADTNLSKIYKAKSDFDKKFSSSIALKNFYISKMEKYDNKIEKILAKSKRQFDIEFKKKNKNILVEDLSVYVNHLCYLLELNHDKYIKEFLNDWQVICRHIQSYIFHSKNADEELYLETLRLNAILIDKTFNNNNHDEYFDTVLDITLNSLHLFKEDLGEDKKEDFIKNFDTLSKKYFMELSRIIEHLYFESKYTELLEKLFFNETFNTVVIKSNSFLKRIGTLNINSINYVEYMLLELLYKCVKVNHNSDLPVLMSLLTDTQKVSNKSKTAALSYGELLNKNKKYSSTNTKGKKTLSSSNLFTDFEDEKTILSDEMLKVIFIIIIKACEIENYKAVGYLVKRVSDSLKSPKQFKKLVSDLKEDIDEEKNKFQFNTLTINLNKYSLNYCYNKATLLFILQMNYRFNHNINFKEFISEEFEKSIIDSFKDKHKEYNLYCINLEYLKSINLIDEKKEKSKYNFISILKNVFRT